MSFLSIQLRHLRAFAAVASTKSFARAAETLAVSQPALSQTIIQLEKIIGFDLFVRTTRSVALTENGQRLLEKAQGLNSAVEGFFAEALTIQLAHRNALRVGYLIGTAVEFIPSITRAFERRHPRAKLEFIEFDFRTPDAGIVAGAVDCAIVRPPIDGDDLELLELTTEPCVVCLPAGHPLARKEAVLLNDILDEPFIAAPRHGAWRDYWLANKYRGGHPPDVAFEAATVESELQAVALRKGISITAESTAKFYARPGVEFRRILDMEPCSIAIAFRPPPSALLQDLVSISQEISTGAPGYRSVQI